MLYNISNPHGGDIFENEEILDFSANTNPFGTPEGVLQAIRDELPLVHRYPDPFCRRLTAAIADHEQVPQDYILCGNGAADLIYAWCDAIRPARAAELAPTFSEYSLGLERNGCEVVRYELRQDRDFTLDEGFLAFLQEKAPGAVFLCNPNNPTGRTVPGDLLRRILSFCRETDTRLFLDECFLDLSESGESMKSLLGEYPQVFILKAFTKSYGMAGVRLGYGMCASRDTLTRMAQQVQPWNVSALAQAAGIAALREQKFLEHTNEFICAERPVLKEKLEKLGFWVCPSTANYLLFRAFPGLDTALKEQGILLRPCANYHGLGAEWFRTAVRLPEENERLIEAIRRVKGE